MSTLVVTDQTAINHQSEDILDDPDVLSALEALDDPKDREDLLCHLKALKRLEEGQDRLIPWEGALKQLGL